ncbi:MAG: sulfatase-like hydrolase/transferase, partial [Rhodospirillales bacterium]|nr:sulfatase-like hydrolase/transferase [Rhodospirillales bacterium]
VFQSDHGHSNEVRAHNGGGSAGPYRGAKFSLFEGGIRVPALISWPGMLPENEVRDQVAHGCDWLPTLAALCRIEPLDGIDGKSLVDVIKSEDAGSPHDVLHWTIGNSWAVRQGDWKLLGNPRDTSNKAALSRDDRLFLVNLAEDVSEMKNLAKQHPEVVERLEKAHKTWAAAIRN